MTPERLLDFADTWSRANVSQILEFFTDDGRYSPSVTGTSVAGYSGKNELRRGIAAMLARDAGSTAKVHNLWLHGDHGSWEWVYTFPDGRQEHGCDLFEFQDDLIKTKNAFRKWRGTP